MIVVRDYASRFHRYPGLAWEMERLLQHRLGGGKSAVYISLSELPVEHDVVFHPGVYHWSIRGHGLLHVSHHRQRLVLYNHRLGHVLRRVRCVSCHSHDRITHKRHFPRRHRKAVVWSCVFARAGCRRPYRVYVRQHLFGRNYADGTRYL